MCGSLVGRTDNSSMPDASVIIVTRNRKDVAKRAVQSALAQEGDVEVLVLDDGSADGTLEYLKAAFPAVRMDRTEKQLGYIVQRNRAVEMSAAPFVFSLDDDAEFADNTTIKQTLTLFEEGRVGVVAIPFLNRYPDGQERKMTPDPPDSQGVWVTNTFIGTAFAVRRDAFLKIGGFQTALYHWGEESEYSQRLLDAGSVVALGRGGMIYHYPAGVGKYPRSNTRYIYRNGVLIVWFNAPWLLVLPLMAIRAGRYLIKGLCSPWALPAMFEGFAMVPQDDAYARCAVQAASK